MRNLAMNIDSFFSRGKHGQQQSMQILQVNNADLNSKAVSRLSKNPD